MVEEGSAARHRASHAQPFSHTPTSRDLGLTSLEDNEGRDGFFFTIDVVLGAVYILARGVPDPRCAQTEASCMSLATGPRARWGATLIVALSLAAALIAGSAARNTSATFDETVLVGGGVRGLLAGDWLMVTDQPPLPMYLYGAAAAGMRPTLPAERPGGWSFNERWLYARELLFRSGNEPSVLLGRARAVAAVIAGLLVAAAGAFAWWVAGPTAGVLAAAMTTLLPDVLAHGGVAYNDLPLALAFLLAVWALDAVTRRPTPLRGMVAGIAVACALCVKLSAVALAPVAVGLLAMEGWRQRGTAGWRRDVLLVGGVGMLTAYVSMVLLYRGDPTLTLFRFNFFTTVFHASKGHIAPAYLLGRTSETGFWYFFPLALIFKTPVGFQALLGGALVAGWAALTGRSHPPGRRLDAVVGWRGRSALLATLVFGGFLIRSSLNVGFRYALPVLPLLAVVAAALLARQTQRRLVRWGVPVLLMAQAASTLSIHPDYLAYSSMWAGGRDAAHRVLVDSSLDWGQGLLELRDFMDAEGVEQVALSYFGSAPPEAYGIVYTPLPSFFRLEGGEDSAQRPAPRFTVISATHLHGLYLGGADPFASYRDRVPYRVLGHHLFVFDEE